MGFVRSIGRAFRRIAKGVSNVFKTVTKPIRKVVGGALGLVGKVLNKIPFGKVLGGFVSKFLGSPLALAAFGPLGGFASLALKALGSGNLAKLATSAAKTPAWSNPIGRANAAHILAYAHARCCCGH